LRTDHRSRKKSTDHNLKIKGAPKFGPCRLGCTLTFASEAEFEIEAKILFRLEAKKKPDFT
jgi:hypothetical protein